MGLFSKKKKHHVGTAVQRVIEDDNLPDTIKTSVINAIITGGPDSSIAEFLINGFGNSIALKADRFYNFGHNGYTRGVPQSNLAVRNDGEAIVKQVIETDLGQGIDLDYYQFAPINALHVGWQKLTDDYGYDALTNEIATLSSTEGFTCYLKDIRPVYTQESFDERDAKALAQWGISPVAGYTPERPNGSATGIYSNKSNYIVDDLAVSDSIEIYYVYLDGAGDLQEDVLVLAYDEFDEDVEYYQVRYHYTDGGSVVHHVYFTYENQEGSYPTIDAITDFEFTALGSYYPFVHLRSDGVDQANSGLPDYDSDVTLLRHLDMSFDDISAAINENPDIDDVEQAMMMFAIDIDDTSQVGMSYLFTHFDALWAAGQDINWRDAVAPGPQFVQVIADRDFQMTFRHAGIKKIRRAGVIGARGTYARQLNEILVDEDFDVRSGLGNAITTSALQSVENAYIFRYQVLDSMYDEIIVYRPELIYHIYRNKSHTAGFGADALLIPLDYSLINGNFSLADEEILLCRSLHFVFNTHIVTRVAWYQTGIFKAVMVILAIVVIVYTGIDLYGVYAAALAEGGVALVQLIITQIVVGVVVAELSKLVIKVVGPELGIYLAAALAIVAFTYGGGMKGIKGAPWADDLLMASNGLVKASQVHTAGLIKDYRHDLQTFEHYAEEKNAELEAAKALLDENNLLDPFAFIGLVPFTYYGEEPQDFYDRTIHAGNVGIKSLNAISYYVDSALTLPSMSDTVGSELYGPV